MHSYKRHIGDYHRDTAHLSQGQHGAYVLLMDWCYSNERALPADKQDIYRIAKAHDKAEKACTDKVLAGFFVVTESGYTQKRIEHELADYRVKAATNQAIAVEREARKKTYADSKKAERNAHGENKNDSRTEHEQSTNRAQSVLPDVSRTEHEQSTKTAPSHKPIANSHLKEESKATGGGSDSSERAQAPAPPYLATPEILSRSEQFARQRGAPTACIPPDWQPSESLQAQLRTSSAMRAMTPEDVQAFRDYYLASGEACADWDAKARSWMQREKKFEDEKALKNQGQSAIGGPPKPGMVRGKSGNWIDPLKDFHDVDYEADAARIKARRDAAQAQHATATE